MNCVYCDKTCKNTNSLRQHEIRCSKNPNKIQFHCPSRKGQKGGNKYTKAAKLGLDKPIISEETRKRLSESSKMQNQFRWTPEARQKFSDVMKAVVRNNPDSYSKNNVSGRVKMYTFEGQTFKGKWELLVAKCLSSVKIEYTNDVSPFEYEWEGNKHLYFPDFYLPSLDLYIEVKGYERERDRCKWKSVHNLVVLKSSHIKELESGKSIIEFL